VNVINIMVYKTQLNTWQLGLRKKELY